MLIQHNQTAKKNEYNWKRRGGKEREWKEQIDGSQNRMAMNCRLIPISSTSTIMLKAAQLAKPTANHEEAIPSIYNKWME